jgi:hypothetical protein
MPKVQFGVEKVTFEQIEVDRRTNCKELWFDMLEHEHLKTMRHSESIDVGNVKIGQLTVVPKSLIQEAR